MKLVNELSLSNHFQLTFDAFQKELTKGISKDYLVSRGEYFSALIISEYLNLHFVDALDIISLHYDGTIDYEKTTHQFNQVITQYKNIVVPGFYGSTPNNQVRLFSRGGSDLTGSILARVSKATLYENWTDVDGIYVADPRVIDNPNKIKNITYNELRELSYRGAQVIQQESIVPLEKEDIPIHIRNTNNPSSFGTFISNTFPQNDDLITGISGMKDYTSLNITKDSDQNFTLVLRDVFDLFIKYRLNVEHIPTGIDTFSIITKTEQVKSVYFDFLNDLQSIKGVTHIEEEDDISLLSIVGRNMAHIPGVAGKIFSILGKHNINIKVIAQASKEISIIVGVSTNDYNNAIKVIYSEFYNQKSE